MATLSVVLITLNEEANIKRCLESVRWADEIIVVDSFSSDRTVDVAKQFTPHVYQQEYPGSTRQMEKGIQYATGDWILFIDGDEEVSFELSEEIQQMLERGTVMTGYELLRKPRAFGKWIYHGGWYPDYQLRLLRKDSYTVNHEEVHGGFFTKGSHTRMRGIVYHYTYETIEEYVGKMNEYTSLQVSNRIKGYSSVGAHWYNFFLSPASHFLRMFFSKKGYRDGFHGFLLAVLDALYSMVLYMKVWEYRTCKEKGMPLPPISNREFNMLKKLQ